MKTVWQDIRYGIRRLKKAPGFTAIALVTLAIGIGSNTIMFSISDMLLLRHPRKVKAPEQLALCAIQDDPSSWFRYPEYQVLRDSGLAFSDLMAQGQDWGRAWHTTLVHGDSAWHTPASYVSANYFSFLGVTPVRGRGFLPAEERPGSAPVVVLSHHCWHRLGSDPELVGEFIIINGTRCQVVGVMPEDFTGVTFLSPDLWLPLGSYQMTSTWARLKKGTTEAKYPRLYLIGRLKPDVTMPVAQAQLHTLLPDFKPEYLQGNPSLRTSIVLRQPGRFFIKGDDEYICLVMTVFSLVLIAASVIILVIACLNMANMLIVQGTSRYREIAIRLALGGGRRRIIRQLFTESLLLALLGGILGVLLAFWSTRILNAWIATAPDHYTRNFRTALDVNVLAATLGACLMATLLSGLRPALWLSRRDIAGEMKASAGSVLGSLRRKRGAISVAGQIALAVALVLSAALLTRSALQIARPDPRFCMEDKLFVQFDWDSTGYDRLRCIQAYEALADHLASLPEVKALGTSIVSFYGGGGPVSVGECLSGEEYNGSGRPLAREAALVGVGRDYFTAMEIPLLRGRFFDPHDHVPNAEKVTIIDESLAHKLRPDGNSLGCLIQWSVMTDRSDPYRVVGIVSHLPDVGSRKVRAQMYTPTEPDRLSSCLYLHVANEESANVLQSRIVEEIHRVDARVPVLSAATLARIRDDHSSVWLARFGARLSFAAGAAALFLAALGIYAIKSYTVASRTSEIGVRMALGATHESITGMVLREGLLLTIVGLIVGLVLGLGVARVSSSMLYGISPIDPVSIVVTVALLGAASLLAGYIPARRAVKIDPMEALRYE